MWLYGCGGVEEGEHGTEASSKERQGDGWSSTWLLKSPWTMTGVKAEKVKEPGDQIVNKYVSSR